MNAFRIIILIGSIFFSLICYGDGQVTLTDQEIKTGKEYFYQFNLDKSARYFKDLTRKYPGEPIPYFYLGYIRMIIYTQDMRNESVLDSFNLAFNQCISLIKKKDFEHSAELNYYLGLSYGAVGLHHVFDKNYFKGFIYGRRAKNYLEKTIKIKPDYYDAYLGLGIYHYYVGLMSGIKKFFVRLLGFGGTTEQGKEEIQLAAQKGKYFKIESQFANDLLEYFIQNNQDDPVASFEELKASYPDNPVFPLVIGYHYRRNRQPEKALTYFTQIDDSVLHVIPQVYFMKHYNMAVCYYLLNDYKNSYSRLELLKQHDTRLTMYDQSAIKYYEAMIDYINGDTGNADSLLKNIPDKTHTSFWYLSSQLFRFNQVPAVIGDILYYQNSIYSDHLNDLEETELVIERAFETDKNSIWYLYYLDLKGVKYYFLENYDRADIIFSSIKPYISNFKGSKYFSGWVEIHHARALMGLNRLKEAGALLENASDIDDDYIKLIVEREKINITKMVN